MQLDAAIALLALAVALGTSIQLSKIPHRKKRIALGAEAAVVTLMVFGAILVCIPALSDRPAKVRKPEESEDLLRVGWYRTVEDMLEARSHEKPHAEWPTEMTSRINKSPDRK